MARKQYTLRDMPEFQARLNEQIDMWLEELLKPENDADDVAWNIKVKTLLVVWREGLGPFSAEAGRHVEAICDALREALK